MWATSTTWANSESEWANLIATADESVEFEFKLFDAAGEEYTLKGMWQLTDAGAATALPCCVGVLLLVLLVVVVVVVVVVVGADDADSKFREKLGGVGDSIVVCISPREPRRFGRAGRVRLYIAQACQLGTGGR